MFFDAAFQSHAVALSAQTTDPRRRNLDIQPFVAPANPKSESNARSRCTFPSCTYYGTAAQGGLCSVHFKQRAQQAPAAAAPSTMVPPQEANVSSTSPPAPQPPSHISGGAVAAGTASLPGIEKPSEAHSPAPSVPPPVLPPADDGSILVRSKYFSLFFRRVSPFQRRMPVFDTPPTNVHLTHKLSL